MIGRYVGFCALALERGEETALRGGCWNDDDNNTARMKNSTERGCYGHSVFRLAQLEESLIRYGSCGRTPKGLILRINNLRLPVMFLLFNDSRARF